MSFLKKNVGILLESAHPLNVKVGISREGNKQRAKM